MSSLLLLVSELACVVGIALGGLRWLRVAQREHYLAGSTARFAVRWWRSTPTNIVLGTIGILGAASAWWIPVAALATAAVTIMGPLGLRIKGRTSPLAWTRRLRTLAAVSVAIVVVILLAGIVLGVPSPIAATVTFLVALVIDLALAILSPIETRASGHFIESASLRLNRVAPRVVGITGSYGKTSTKNHLVALVGGDLTVVPSPRSFNNRAGLARAVNEHLADGTQVFVAEMGTYGPGEIAEMCSWCPPEIAVLTAIGPVHLERFGSLETTLSSKAEIAEQAQVVVVNIDDDLLAGLAEQLALTAKRVIRVSSMRRDADVVVEASDQGWAIRIDGVTVSACPSLIGVQPTNVACAIGAALALGLDASSVAARVAGLSSIENRIGVIRAPSGVVIIDDTFNSNPAGAAAALSVLSRLEVPGRKVVVTPGMIELGAQQDLENEKFAMRSGEIADVVVCVQRTNLRSLRRGLSKHPTTEVLEVATRDDAVRWVRESLGDGDAVLYENDLPDNYP